jgi:selenide,water dikinase
MVDNTGLSAELELTKIPLLPGVENYTKEFIYPDNTTRNYNAVKEKVHGMNGLEFMTLCDPQTSGGLLISVDVNHKTAFEKLLAENKQEAFLIGKIEGKRDKLIFLK